jgi:hypothetical protein
MLPYIIDFRKTQVLRTLTYKCGHNNSINFWEGSFVGVKLKIKCQCLDFFNREGHFIQIGEIIFITRIIDGVTSAYPLVAYNLQIL